MGVGAAGKVSRMEKLSEIIAQEMADALGIDKGSVLTALENSLDMHSAEIVQCEGFGA